MSAALAPTDGRARRARAQRDKRRAEILKAAARVFATKGFELGSISDVIEKAGIARGTFYLHFESKHAIVGELLDDLLQTLDATVERVDVGSTVSPYDQLIGNLVRVLEVLDEHVDVTRILLGGTHPAELAPRVEAFWRESLALIRSSLSTGVELGIVRSIDVDVVAPAILGALKESVARLVVVERAPLDRQELARKLLDYLLFGLLVRS
ncbi:MAG: TetR/AcrR family transcriptional regulator [Deltaproteobacteria bacterium]|nr:TetR/AcrR family transcriptional regulator [Deltaproteobacteria bacterium]